MSAAFKSGFIKMFPILTGVVPFGIVVGSVSSEAGLTFWHSTFMTLILYAGASQLAALDLMSKLSPVLVVVVTGLIINLRFILYSASMAPHVRGEGFWTKLFVSHTLTDQAYALMTANEDRIGSSHDHVQFYMGASTCMTLGWTSSVALGFLFGNFAPKELSLEFAVPLSFVVLVVPALKNRKYLAVAIFSSVASVLFYQMPFRTGLITAVACAMSFAWFITRKKAA